MKQLSNPKEQPKDSIYATPVLSNLSPKGDNLVNSRTNFPKNVNEKENHYLSPAEINKELPQNAVKPKEEVSPYLEPVNNNKLKIPNFPAPLPPNTKVNQGNGNLNAKENHYLEPINGNLKIPNFPAPLPPNTKMNQGNGNLNEKENHYLSPAEINKQRPQNAVKPEEEVSPYLEPVNGNWKIPNFPAPLPPNTKINQGNGKLGKNTPMNKIEEDIYSVPTNMPVDNQVLSVRV
jgi:hypothetical protein